MLESSQHFAGSQQSTSRIPTYCYKCDTDHPALVSVHSATLGKGQSDDTLIKIKNGDMDGKGEVTLVFGKQVRESLLHLITYRVLNKKLPHYRTPTCQGRAEI